MTEIPPSQPHLQIDYAGRTIAKRRPASAWLWLAASFLPVASIVVLRALGANIGPMLTVLASQIERIVPRSLAMICLVVLWPIPAMIALVFAWMARRGFIGVDSSAARAGRLITWVAIAINAGTILAALLSMIVYAVGSMGSLW